MLGSVEIGGLVEHFRALGKDHEAMGEARWNPEHTAIAGAQRFAYPLAKGGGVPAKIDGDVEDLSAQTADELSLRLLHLVMKATHHVLVGKRLIVLNKGAENAEVRQNSFIVAFKKGASAIVENSRFQELHIGNLGCYCLHRLTSLVWVATRISANTSSSCCRHEGSRKAKARANLSLASTELAGRLAGVGYSAPGIGCIRGPVGPIAALKMAQANPYQEVEPAAVMW